MRCREAQGADALGQRCLIGFGALDFKIARAPSLLLGLDAIQYMSCFRHRVVRALPLGMSAALVASGHARVQSLRHRGPLEHSVWLAEDGRKSTKLLAVNIALLKRLNVFLHLCTGRLALSGNQREDFHLSPIQECPNYSHVKGCASLDLR